MTDVAVSANPDGAPRGNRRTRTDEIGGRISNHTRIGISFDPPQQAAGERRHYDQRHRKPDWRKPHRWLHIVAAGPRLAAIVALFSGLDLSAALTRLPTRIARSARPLKASADKRSAELSSTSRNGASVFATIASQRPSNCSVGGDRSLHPTRAQPDRRLARGFGFHRDLSLREGRQARISAHSLPVTRRSSAGVSGNTENGVPAAAHTVVKRWRSASSSSVTGCACPSGATPPIV